MGGSAPQVVFAFLVLTASPLYAEAPAGLTLARQVVDEQRGGGHARQMRVLWPDLVAATPRDGAEAILIRGFIDYEEPLRDLDLEADVAARRGLAAANPARHGPPSRSRLRRRLVGLV